MRRRLFSFGIDIMRDAFAFFLHACHRVLTGIYKQVNKNILYEKVGGI